MTAMTEPSYEDQAAQFIADTERYAALGLPELPADDPKTAAAMRAAGYEVLAECTKVDGGVATVSVLLGEYDTWEQQVVAAHLAGALGTDATALPGTECIATLRETVMDGRTLSGFRPLPG